SIDTSYNGTDALTIAAVNGSAANVGNIITLPSGALLTVNADGSYVYNANGHFENGGVDSFTYQALDSTLGILSNSATVMISIAPEVLPSAVPEMNNIMNVSGNTVAGDIIGSALQIGATSGDTSFGTDGGLITNVAVLSLVGGMGSVLNPIIGPDTPSTMVRTITQADIDSSIAAGNNGFTAANLGDKAIMVMDSFGNELVVDEVTGKYVYMLNAQFAGSINAETFQYTITTTDGHMAQSTLTLNINNGLGPVVLDLNGSGIHLTSAQNSQVSVNGHLIGWIANGDGVLAFDPSGHGKITNLNQIDFASYVPGAKTDLQGLIAFDTNHNGMLDLGDIDYSKFGVILANGQFETLTQLGITSISLTSNHQLSTMNGNVINGLSTFQTSDGHTHTVADVNFQVGAAGKGTKLNISDVFPERNHLDFSNLPHHHDKHENKEGGSHVPVNPTGWHENAQHVASCHHSFNEDEHLRHHLEHQVHHVFHH
ncbi:MAG: Ig-like domain-containing protein, partial [Candidatus Berkiellales bacterium]